MATTETMIAAHPRTTTFDQDALTRCIEACFECARSCTICADACLAEPQVQALVHCIRLNLDCADVCDATGRVLSRLSDPHAELLRAQLEACEIACRACAEECERHAGDMGMEHCRACAASCRRCEAACAALVRAA